MHQMSIDVTRQLVNDRRDAREATATRERLLRQWRRRTPVEAVATSGLPVPTAIADRRRTAAEPDRDDAVA